MKNEYAMVWGMWLLTCAALGAADSGAAPNKLSAEEKAAGWRLLFDGETTRGWRSFGGESFPAQGWEVQGGWLRKVPKVRGGDIVTVEQFTDFELSWDWRLAPGGNNGVKYFIIEKRGAIGHEYQMLDDIKGDRGKGSTASFYEVLAPREDKPMKPAGEINHSRIRVEGQHVEHWLNGMMVLEYELGSEEVMAGVAKSKFKKVPGFGTKTKGHILLTDHQDEAWFQNVKIRVLPDLR